MLCEVKAGNGVEVTVTFKDKDGNLDDPTEASIVVRAPDGTETTYTGGTLTHEGTGAYTAEFIPSVGGKWWVKGVGTGNVTAVGEDYVLVFDTVA